MIPIKPIGFAKTPYQTKAEVPRQAHLSAPGRIELLAESGFEHALEDLEAWSHIWVLFQFHQAENWRPKVLPPRSDVRRGVFATRSPHRPNGLGLSAVQLLSVRGRNLEVAGLDLVDGTPILDLKPYVPYTDCIREANSGWLPEAPSATGTAPERPTLDWQVHFRERALAQLEFLRGCGEDLTAKLTTLLETGPAARPYRRIRMEGDHSSIAFGPWRARFVHDQAARRIEVLSLATGYRQAQLSDDDGELEVQRAFVARFGYPGYD